MTNDEVAETMLARHECCLACSRVRDDGKCSLMGVSYSPAEPVIRCDGCNLALTVYGLSNVARDFALNGADGLVCCSAAFAAAGPCHRYWRRPRQ